MQRHVTLVFVRQMTAYFCHFSNGRGSIDPCTCRSRVQDINRHPRLPYSPRIKPTHSPLDNLTRNRLLQRQVLYRHHEQRNRGEEVFQLSRAKERVQCTLFPAFVVLQLTLLLGQMFNTPSKGGPIPSLRDRFLLLPPSCESFDLAPPTLTHISQDGMDPVHP